MANPLARRVNPWERHAASNQKATLQMRERTGHDPFKDNKGSRRDQEVGGEPGRVPAEVASTEQNGEPGILRFEFPNAPNRKDSKLKEIEWDDFFEKFDENDLELVYQEKTASGDKSNFNKLVHPESEEHSSHSKSHGSSHSGHSSHSDGNASRSSSSSKEK